MLFLTLSRPLQGSPHPCSHQGLAVTPCIVISKGYARMTILGLMKMDSWRLMQLQHHPCLS
eukprot:2631147-Rhodomonas_salina.1